MLLENNFKNYDNIRRKAYNVDNPVQAKGAARGKKIPLYHQNCVAVQPTIGVEGEGGVSLTPSCAPLARGYQRVRPTVFFLKIHSFEHYFNLSKVE